MCIQISERKKKQTNPALQWFRKIHRWWSGATKSQAKPTQAEMTFPNSTALILLLGKSACAFVPQPDTTISFLHIWFPTWLLWYHKKLVWKHSGLFMILFLWRLAVLPKLIIHGCFLGRRQRGGKFLKICSKKLGEMLPLFLTHFSDLWHTDILNPLAHTVEIKEHSWSPPSYQWACNKLRGSKAFLFSIMSVVKLRIQRNLQLQRKPFLLID